MSTQKGLRDRLRSVKNMLHITQAMEIVSSVRFRKVMQKMEHLRFYAHTLTEVVLKLKLSTHAIPHPLLQKRECRRTCLIIVGGDKGLCGSYNSSICKEAERFLKKYGKDQVELILVGNKMIEHFKRSSWPIKATISDYTRKLNDSTIGQWADELAALFTSGHYDQIWVAFTRFTNIVLKEAVVEQLLPIEGGVSTVHKESIDFICEPAPEEIYANIIPLGFLAKVHALLVEAYSSELASRMIAMKAATKNAEEMIDKLTLIKNKNRQLTITNEILEITAGAEGLK